MHTLWSWKPQRSTEVGNPKVIIRLKVILYLRCISILRAPSEDPLTSLVCNKYGVRIIVFRHPSENLTLRNLNCDHTPNLPTNIVDFGGFDSSIILILRGGIPRPIGDFPESLSQAMLVGCDVSREIGRITNTLSHNISVVAPHLRSTPDSRSKKSGAPGGSRGAIPLCKGKLSNCSNRGFLLRT